MRRLVPCVLVVGMIAAACGGGDDSSETTLLSLPESTTTLIVPPESDVTTTIVTVPPTEATTPPTIVVGVPSYELVDVGVGTDSESIVVVVEAGDYSNVQLENLVFDIVDRFAPTTAVVVDDAAAAQLLGTDDMTDADRDYLAAHTVLTIENGIDVTFQGPYADLPGITIGS